MTIQPDQPGSGQWQGAVHRLPVRVYYEDTDFTGVVYYANYLKFFERGRTDALRTAGVSHTNLLALQPPLGFVVRRITVDYLSPGRIDDALVVETRFELVRGARMSIRQRILRDSDSLATASVDAACIDLSGRPRRLPDSVLASIERVSQPPV